MLSPRALRCIPPKMVVATRGARFRVFLQNITMVVLRVTNVIAPALDVPAQLVRH